MIPIIEKMIFIILLLAAVKLVKNEKEEAIYKRIISRQQNIYIRNANNPKITMTYFEKVNYICTL